jgi:hypothetical protein
MNSSSLLLGTWAVYLVGYKSRSNPKRVNIYLDYASCEQYDEKNVMEIAMPIESDLLRQAMRFWAIGVTIVSAAYGGFQHGITVSSFTSVSLDPARVLVSLACNTRTHNLITLGLFLNRTIT